jgi:hypothetical protein
MATYDPIIEELEREQSNLKKLHWPLRMNQVRVTRHPPGGATADCTDEYEEGFRKAMDALHKAIAALKLIP